MIDIKLLKLTLNLAQVGADYDLLIIVDASQRRGQQQQQTYGVLAGAESEEGSCVQEMGSCV
jgi:hypothetical protein